MRRRLSLAAVAVVALLAASTARAGGGPANVLVLYNEASAEGRDLAERYAVARSLPPGHLCGVGGLAPSPVGGVAFGLYFEDFVTIVRDRLDACLAALPHPDEIDYLVVTRGMPHTVSLAGGGAYQVSLESMLQIHHAIRVADGAELGGQEQFHSTELDFYVPSFINPEYRGRLVEPGDFAIPAVPGSEVYNGASAAIRAAELPPAFRRAAPREGPRVPYPGVPDERYDYGGQLFIVTRLDGFDGDDAAALIDRALAAERGPPEGEIICMRGGDDSRGIRDAECEMVIRHLAMAGLPAIWIPEHDATLSGRRLAALFTGAVDLRAAIDGNTFAPGALVSNITSGGSVPDNFYCDTTGTVCPESESQTSNARFVRAGATSVEGATVEPTVSGFPRASALLYYTFGYSLGESVLFSEPFLYWQQQLIGDPLTTPWGERPRVTMRRAGAGVRVEATHPDGIARIELRVDGTRLAEADTDTLVVDSLDPAATHVLAIAVARNRTHPRPGWPSAMPMVFSDVQGWTTEIGPELPRPDAGSVTPEDDAADTGCGCTTPGATSPDPIEPWAASALAFLAMLCRRRPTW